MLYYLFKYLHTAFQWPGAGLIKYISFRAAMATLASFTIIFVLGKRFINWLHQKQIIESNRLLGFDETQRKSITPTMGGLLIIVATVVPTLLFSKLHNIYIILLLTTTIWMGFIGFLDDYIKVFKKKKHGLNGWIKLLGQVILGTIVSATLYFHEDVVIRELSLPIQEVATGLTDQLSAIYSDVKSTKTTIPFFKENELDYGQITAFLLGSTTYTWLLYMAFIAFIIASVSNGANLTDGLDGLAASTSVIVGTTLAILAYLSGHIIFAKYLKIMYIPNLGELAIFCCAFVGACMGFLWYNAYPAQVFMGDTGSLTIGAIIAVVAICIRKELLLPMLCGVFLVENLSVVLQTGYFKFTKKRYGIGRRIFKMAPLHHHYQKLGWHESKIVTRFLIISILLAVATLITLKIR